MARPLSWQLLHVCLGLCCLQCSGLRRQPGPASDGLPLSTGVKPLGRKEARRHRGGSQPISGEEVQPVGRHIQYLFLNRPHGITDRIRYYFQPLVALGKFLNATVHIPGGALGPRNWLDAKHSFEVAEDWGRYFDLQANGGNPWHELQNFSGCRTLSDPPRSIEEWARVFDDGSLCVNIAYHLKWRKLDVLRDIVHRMQPKMTVSPAVRTAAGDFLARYGVQGAFGFCHLRRCDRLGSSDPNIDTRNRTTPKAIHAEIAKNAGLRTWLFFVYAEKGYIEELRTLLEPLRLKLLFEDEVALNEHYPQDNYFTYVLGKHLSSQAQLVLETDSYTGDSAPSVHSPADVQADGLYLGREESFYSREEAYLATEEQYEATCEGERLLPPSPGTAEHESA